MKKIKTVYSHPQAIAQCKTWLYKNLPNTSLKESSSTSEAARIVAKQKETASISPLECSNLYSLNVLKTLLNKHTYPAIALGDFNVNTQEDTKLDIYKAQESDWSVAHLNGCKKCKGSYYYNYGKRWEFLDSIFLSKERGLSYVSNSIDVHTTIENSYSDTGKPMDFNPNTKKGVSDHLPMVARIKIN